MKYKVGNTLWGILFIAIGIGFAGNVFHWWDFTLFFDGWWTLFIIIPCLISMVQSGVSTGNAIGLVIGVLLLLSAQNLLGGISIGQLILPLLLVAIGVAILFHNLFQKPPAQIPEQVTRARRNYSSVFSGQDIKYPAEDFTGCNISAVFGGVELDLRNAFFREDSIVTVSAVFGGVTLFLPPDVKVEVNNLPIFGGVSNHTGPIEGMNCPTLYIKSTCIFGGVDIK